MEQLRELLKEQQQVFDNYIKPIVSKSKDQSTKNKLIIAYGNLVMIQTQKYVASLPSRMDGTYVSTDEMEQEQEEEEIEEMEFEE
jgi:hypothetical protein